LIDWLSILTGIASENEILIKKKLKPVTTVSKKKSKPVKPIKGKLKTNFPDTFSVLKNASVESGYDLDKFLKLISVDNKLETNKHKHKQTRGKIGKDKK
jgi:hypothetical protein